MKIQTTIGVDLHKCQLNTAVLDQDGRIVERWEMATKCRKKIAEYFASYGSRAQVAVESVGFYQWFWDLVRPQVGTLHLADPAGVRAHAGRKAKTDRNDALLLATLLRDKRLPMAYVPREPVRQLREMGRHRHSVAGALAGEWRSLRWLACRFTELWGDWLRLLTARGKPCFQFTRDIDERWHTKIWAQDITLLTHMFLHWQGWILAPTPSAVFYS